MRVGASKGGEREMLNPVGGGVSPGGGSDTEGDFNRKSWRLQCNVRIIKDG